MIIVDLFHKFRVGPRRFRFESFWCNMMIFRETVKKGWNDVSGNLGVNPVDGVAIRLSSCEKTLRSGPESIFPIIKKQLII